MSYQESPQSTHDFEQKKQAIAREISCWSAEEALESKAYQLIFLYFQDDNNQDQVQLLRSLYEFLSHATSRTNSVAEKALNDLSFLDELSFINFLIGIITEAPLTQEGAQSAFTRILEHLKALEEQKIEGMVNIFSMRQNISGQALSLMY